MTRIVTRRLVLRSFEPTDARQVSDNSRQPRVAHAMSDMIHPDEAAALRWIEWVDARCRDASASAPVCVLAIESKADAVCIGLVGYAPKQELDDEIEVLYAVADPYQGRGYATEAAAAVVARAFEHDGLNRLSAIVKPDNVASRRVIEKIGFVYREERVLPYDGHPTRFRYYQLGRNHGASASAGKTS